MPTYKYMTKIDNHDLEICRALFDRNPDRLLELVSEWMEENKLSLSDEFRLPDYINRALSEIDRSRCSEKAVRRWLS